MFIFIKGDNNNYNFRIGTVKLKKKLSPNAKGPTRGQEEYLNLKVRKNIKITGFVKLLTGKRKIFIYLDSGVNINIVNKKAT